MPSFARHTKSQNMGLVGGPHGGMKVYKTECRDGFWASDLQNCGSLVWAHMNRVLNLLGEMSRTPVGGTSQIS